MRLSTIAAMVLPALVLSAEIVWLATPVERPVSAVRALNDANLAKSPPGIVIVGNSKAGSDIDARLLAKELDYKKPIPTVIVYGSSAPAWYAMLEQRVYGQGYSPELIVVYGQLGALLRTEVQRQSERDAVEAELSKDSPVLDDKVFKRRGGWAARTRKRANELHASLLGQIRDLSVGLLQPASPGGVRTAGAAVAGPALEEVFGEKATFHEVRQSKLIGVEAIAAGTTAMQAGDTPPEDSLIPDMVALANAHGAKIVFVRAPLPASTAYTDAVPQTTERAAVDLFERLGVSWIDLHALDLGSGAWRDGYHMLPGGEAALTRSLAERMRTAKVLGGGVARSRPVLVPAAVARTGTAELPPLKLLPMRDRPCGFRAVIPGMAHLGEELLQLSGIGRATPWTVSDTLGPLTGFAAGNTLGTTCSGEWRYRKTGLELSPHDTADPDSVVVALSPEPKVADQQGRDVWWIYPGTRTEWRFEEAWEGPLHIEVEVRAVGEGQTGSLRVGELEVPLVADGRVLRASLDVPAVTAPWTLSVGAATDTWLVLEGLELGLEGPQRLVGAPPVTLNAIAGTFQATDPPPLAVGPIESEGGAVKLGLPGLGGLSDEALRTRIAYPCSPVQVRGVDEDWWTDGRRAIPKIAKSERTYGHIGGALFASPPGPHTVRLDPDRKCLARRWIYPGDEVSWGIGGGPVSQLRLGADLLVLSARTFSETPASVNVIVKPRDKVRGTLFEQTVTLDTPDAKVCVRIDPPVPPRMAMDFAVVGDPTAYVLLESVEIGESEHMEGCSK